jgi:hypothetical protein
MAGLRIRVSVFLKDGVALGLGLRLGLEQR